MADLPLATVKLVKTVGLVYMGDAIYACLPTRSRLRKLRNRHSGPDGAVGYRKRDRDVTGQDNPGALKNSVATILNLIDPAFILRERIS